MDCGDLAWIYKPEQQEQLKTASMRAILIFLLMVSLQPKWVIAQPTLTANEYNPLKTTVSTMGGEATANAGYQQGSYNGYVYNNELLLAGTFEDGVGYTVNVYTMIGSKVYTREYISSGNTQRFDLGRQIAPGIYVVSLTKKNDAAYKEIIKVVKQ